MKPAKKALGILLAVILAVSFPATAFAQEYDTDAGSIVVYGGEDGQTVTQLGVVENEIQTSETVITSSSSEGSDHWIFLVTSDGDVSVTLQNVNAGELYIETSGGNAAVTVEGTNTFNNMDSEDHRAALHVSNYYSVTPNSNSATFTGSGVINAFAQDQAMYINGSIAIIDGPAINAVGGCFGVTIVGGTGTEESTDIWTANLTVNSGSITGTAAGDAPYVYEGVEVGSSGIFFTDNTTLNLGADVRVFDAEGNDITDAALADPTVLNDCRTSTIKKVDNTGVITLNGADGKAEVQILGAYYGSAVEKTGEPDAAAMELLSQGIDGECVYKGSFAFTDTLEKHGSFQLNFVLPHYAGQHVIIATIADGAQVTYDRWVGNDGIACINVDHLGDFAVFLA